MAVKEHEAQMKQRSRSFVIDGLAAPFAFFDILADIHLSDSSAQADANALREVWESVGDSIRDAMRAESPIVESTNDRNYG